MRRWNEVRKATLQRSWAARKSARGIGEDSSREDRSSHITTNTGTVEVLYRHRQVAGTQAAVLKGVKGVEPAESLEPLRITQQLEKGAVGTGGGVPTATHALTGEGEARAIEK